LLNIYGLKRIGKIGWPEYLSIILIQIFALYLADNWNYGDTDIHYYSAGGSYSKGRTRFAMNYGRQRGGLICIGGVCRFVPENTGLTANLTVNF
jgi:hypothetical protein